MTILDSLAEIIQTGDVEATTRLIEQAMDQGDDATTLLNQGLIAGMDAVGDKFQAGEIYIPHMLLAARAMHAAIGILKPSLVQSGVEPAGHIVLGTVKGDHHDIGKNLVKIMLEGKGFEVKDLGIDVAPAAFADAVTEDIQIVAMSALLSTTAPFIEETIEALEKAGVRQRIKIIIGGGIVTQEMADAYGADAYGQDAAVGAVKAMALMKAFAR